jgi:hypothetical protein
VERDARDLTPYIADLLLMPAVIAPGAACDALLAARGAEVRSAPGLTA